MSLADDTSSDEDEDVYHSALWGRKCLHAKGYLFNAPAKEMKVLALLLLGDVEAPAFARFDVALCVFLARCIQFNRSAFDPYLTPPGVLGCGSCSVDVLYPKVGLSVSGTAHLSLSVIKQLLAGRLPTDIDPCSWNDADSVEFLATAILSCQPDILSIAQHIVCVRWGSLEAEAARKLISVIALCNSPTVIRLLFHPGGLFLTNILNDAEELRVNISASRGVTLVALHTIEGLLCVPTTSEADYLRTAMSNTRGFLEVATWAAAFLPHCGVDNVLRKLDEGTKERLGISLAARSDEKIAVSLLWALYGRTGLPKARPSLFTIVEDG